MIYCELLAFKPPGTVHVTLNQKLVVPRGRPRRIRFYKLASFTPLLTDIYWVIAIPQPKMGDEHPTSTKAEGKSPFHHPLRTSTRVRVPPANSSPSHSTNRAFSPLNGPICIGITSFGARHSLGLRAGNRLAPAGSIMARVRPRTARAPRPCARRTRRATRALPLPAARAALARRCASRE